MTIELNWNFEEWFNHNKKLMQEFKERMFNEEQTSNDNKDWEISITHITKHTVYY